MNYIIKSPCYSCFFPNTIYAWVVCLFFFAFMLFLSLVLCHAWNSFSGFLNTLPFQKLVGIRVLHCLRKGSNKLRPSLPTMAKSKCPGSNISDPQAYPTFFPASRHLTKSLSHTWWWLMRTVLPPSPKIPLLFFTVSLTIPNKFTPSANLATHMLSNETYVHLNEQF